MGRRIFTFVHMPVNKAADFEPNDHRLTKDYIPTRKERLHGVLDPGQDSSGRLPFLQDRVIDLRNILEPVFHGWILRATQSNGLGVVVRRAGKILPLRVLPPGVPVLADQGCCEKLRVKEGKRAEVQATRPPRVAWLGAVLLRVASLSTDAPLGFSLGGAGALFVRPACRSVVMPDFPLFFINLLPSS